MRLTEHFLNILEEDANFKLKRVTQDPTVKAGESKFWAAAAQKRQEPWEA